MANVTAWIAIGMIVAIDASPAWRGIVLFGSVKMREDLMMEGAG